MFFIANNTKILKKSNDRTKIQQIKNKTNKNRNVLFLPHSVSLTKYLNLIFSFNKSSL